MPTSLRSVLPLLRGAGCFSADAVVSLGNCSLQCHCRPTYSWSPISTSGRLITYTLVPSTCNVPPASEGCGMPLSQKGLESSCPGTPFLDSFRIADDPSRID